jgi:hypothetical protein
VEATQRRVQGIITAVDAKSVTIAPPAGRATVTGRVDGTTKVTIDGKAAKVTDLHVTFAAKAELGLDDVWTAIAVDSTR